MAEYIDRNALVSDMKKRYCTECNSYDGVICKACWVDDAIGEVEDAPAADVAPVVHGRWEWYGPCWAINGYSWGTCSNCKELLLLSDKDHYCHNCGAKMEFWVNADE